MDYSAGRKFILAILLGDNTLWEERYSVGMLDDNSAGDTVVMLEVSIDFAGDEKTSPRTIFLWLLAEDNPVISWWGKVGWFLRLEIVLIISVVTLI